jgi:hypothetical protein
MFDSFRSQITPSIQLCLTRGNRLALRRIATGCEGQKRGRSIQRSVQTLRFVMSTRSLLLTKR